MPKQDLAASRLSRADSVTFKGCGLLLRAMLVAGAVSGGTFLPDGFTEPFFYIVLPAQT